jgi:hypothetical protein
MGWKRCILRSFRERRTLITALAQETITGKLWTVQRGRIREYRPERPEEEREDA